MVQVTVFKGVFNVVLADEDGMFKFYEEEKEEWIIQKEFVGCLFRSDSSQPFFYWCLSIVLTVTISYSSYLLDNRLLHQSWAWLIS